MDEARPASSAVPPPGPATPVIETATSAGVWARTPCAMARATACDTAPSATIRAAGTPSISVLAALE